LAEYGLFSVGIDRQDIALLSARSQFGFDDGCCFMKYDVTPDTVDNLPKFDVILLLAVYHHWFREFPVAEAELMLEALLERSEKLFFEVPERDINSPNYEATSGTSVERHTEYLQRLCGEDKELEFIETVPHTGGDRNDLLFKISII
jgi:hypothetical protein